MKNIICFFLICLSVFSETYTISELLGLYEKNSYNSKEKEITEKQQLLKEKDIKMGSFDKFTMEINPSILREERENTYAYNLNFSYENFYYKTKFDEKREKTSENIGYSTTIMDGFFQEKIDKRISLETLNIEKIKEKKNFREKKKELIEDVFSYLIILENIKNSEELIKESLMEKEIINKKEKLGEISPLDILTNQNEISFLENNLVFYNKEKENAYKKIKNTLGIINDFTIELKDKSFSIREDRSDMEILKSNLLILENQIKNEKLNQLKNISVSYNYDKMNKSNTGSLSYLFTPFENKPNKRILDLEKEKNLINQKELEENIREELKNTDNRYNYLKSEFERNENYYEKYKEYYENYKEKFEKSKISYGDYLKIKRDFIEVKKNYDNSYFEFEKFKYLNDI